METPGDVYLRWQREEQPKWVRAENTAVSFDRNRNNASAVKVYIHDNAIRHKADGCQESPNNTQSGTVCLSIVASSQPNGVRCL